MIFFHKYLHLTYALRVSIINPVLSTPPMPVSAHQTAQKQRVRVTLEFDVYEDFDARNIDYDKMFDLQGDENVEVYVEDSKDVW